MRGTGYVTRIEHTPTQQRNTQRREITGARQTVISASLLRRIVVDQKRSVWSIPREWQVTNYTAGDHSGTRTQALEQLILKKSLSFFVGSELDVRIRSYALLHQTCVRLHKLLVTLFIHTRARQR